MMHVLLCCCISRAFSKLLFNVGEPSNVKKNQFGVVEVLFHNFKSFLCKAPYLDAPKDFLDFFFSPLASRYL